MQTNKTTVIYHSADFDGIFCREVAKHFLGNEGVEYTGWDFGQPKIPMTMEGTYYILDLSPDCLGGDCYDSSRIIWIDHHKSSIEKWPATIPGYRIDGVSACRLAWQWFSHLQVHERPEDYPLPEKQHFIDRNVLEPLAVRLAGEYDIWDKRDERAEIFQFGLRSRELSPFDWTQMLSTERPSIEEVERLISVGHQTMLESDGSIAPAVVFGLLDDGKTLQRYQQANDASVMNFRSFVVEFEGLKFLTLNTARCNSLTFAAKDVPETGHDALMGFYFDGKAWKFSLYHARHNLGIDLSAIAVRFGGGGHRGACGFPATVGQVGFGNGRLVLGKS